MDVDDKTNMNSYTFVSLYYCMCPLARLESLAHKYLYH